MKLILKNIYIGTLDNVKNNGVVFILIFIIDLR